MSSWAERVHRRAADIGSVVTSCGHPGPTGNTYPYRLEKVKFGVPLEEVCKNDNIPGPLLVLILKLNKESPNRRDVFRAPGHQGAMKKLIHFLQAGRLVNVDNYSVYTIASVLKKFLRKIPNGIFGRVGEQELFAINELEQEAEQSERLHRLFTSLPKYTQHLLVLLFGTFRVIASNAAHACTGMTSEALGVSVAPSFFQTCVSDGKNARMEDVLKFKVATRIMKHIIDKFATHDLFGRENYEYYARVTGRILKVQDEWICSFQYPPPPRGKLAQQKYALQHSLEAEKTWLQCQCERWGLLAQEESRSTPALLTSSSSALDNSVLSLGVTPEHSFIESCARLSVSLEGPGLFALTSSPIPSTRGNDDERADVLEIVDDDDDDDNVVADDEDDDDDDDDEDVEHDDNPRVAMNRRRHDGNNFATELKISNDDDIENNPRLGFRNKCIRKNVPRPFGGASNIDGNSSGIGVDDDDEVTVVKRRYRQNRKKAAGTPTTVTRAQQQRRLRGTTSKSLEHAQLSGENISLPPPTPPKPPHLQNLSAAAMAAVAAEKVGEFANGAAKLTRNIHASKARNCSRCKRGIRHSSSCSSASASASGGNGGDSHMTMEELRAVNRYAESTKSLSYLPQVHERQTARMRTRSEWFLGPEECINMLQSTCSNCCLATPEQRQQQLHRYQRQQHRAAYLGGGSAGNMLQQHDDEVLSDDIYMLRMKRFKQQQQQQHQQQQQQYLQQTERMDTDESHINDYEPQSKQQQQQQQHQLHSTTRSTASGGDDSDKSHLYSNMLPAAAAATNIGSYVATCNTNFSSYNNDHNYYSANNNNYNNNNNSINNSNNNNHYQQPQTYNNKANDNFNENAFDFEFHDVAVVVEEHIQQQQQQQQQQRNNLSATPATPNKLQQQQQQQIKAVAKITTSTAKLVYMPHTQPLQPRLHSTIHKTHYYSCDSIRFCVADTANSDENNDDDVADDAKKVEESLFIASAAKNLLCDISSLPHKQTLRNSHSTHELIHSYNSNNALDSIAIANTCIASSPITNSISLSSSSLASPTSLKQQQQQHEGIASTLLRSTNAFEAVATTAVAAAATPPTTTSITCDESDFKSHAARDNKSPAARDSKSPAARDSKSPAARDSESLAGRENKLHAESDSRSHTTARDYVARDQDDDCVFPTRFRHSTPVSQRRRLHARQRAPSTSAYSTASTAVYQSSRNSSRSRMTTFSSYGAARSSSRSSSSGVGNIRLSNSAESVQYPVRRPSRRCFAVGLPRQYPLRSSLRRNKEKQIKNSNNNYGTISKSGNTSKSNSNSCDNNHLIAGSEPPSSQQSNHSNNRNHLPTLRNSIAVCCSNISINQQFLAMNSNIFANFPFNRVGSRTVSFENRQQLKMLLIDAAEATCGDSNIRSNMMDTSEDVQKTMISAIEGGEQQKHEKQQHEQQRQLQKQVANTKNAISGCLKPPRV